MNHLVKLLLVVTLSQLPLQDKPEVTLAYIKTVYSTTITLRSSTGLEGQTSQVVGGRFVDTKPVAKYKDARMLRMQPYRCYRLYL